MSQIKKIIIYFYLLMAVILSLLGYILFFEISQNDLEFIVFDIGQGDAILIRTPDHKNILIDGGPDNSVVYKLGQYLLFHDRHIDLMILTHPHADHMVGLTEVLKRYQVKKIFISGAEYKSSDYSAWLDLVKTQKITLEVVDYQVKILLDNNIWLDILYPNASLFGQELKNINNASIVAKLIYQDFSVMLTGDFENEESLVNQGLDLSADILKVGHHGSNNANDLEFLKAVNPSLAVISSGKDNKFNHPHEETVQNLLNLEAQIFRTDQQGDFYKALKIK